jgi:hypothetical protein
MMQDSKTNETNETGPSKGRFRIWCFTRNFADCKELGDLPFEWAPGVMEQTLSVVGTDPLYVFQLEKGESGTLHYQGVIRFKHPIRFSTLREAMPGAHLERCRSWSHSIKYCGKPDGRVHGPITNIKDYTPPEEADILQNLRPWQSDFMRRFDTDVGDGRSIHWIVDTDGGKGKTALQRYLCIKYPYRWAFIDCGKRADILYIATRVLKRGRKHLLFNLTRTCEGFVSYSSFESISDGIWSSSKYESVTTVLARHVHVIIFANFLPEYEKLSLDRWKVYNLDNYDEHTFDI